MKKRMLEVVWIISHPFCVRGKAELAVFDPEQLSLNAHLASMTGTKGVYNASSAKVIGVRELDFQNPVEYLRGLAKKYDFSGLSTDIGHSGPEFGLLEMHAADIAERIVRSEEGFQSLENYLQKT